MSKESSFDIVSKVDLAEVTNAIHTALKEIETRFDFKGSKSSISLEKEEIVLISDDEFKLGQVKDILIGKLVKRNVPVKNLEYGKMEPAAGGRFGSVSSLCRASTRTMPRRSPALSKKRA